MSKKVIIISSIIGLIILAVAIYFTFFFYYSCTDASCFKSHQVKCAKTKFINNEEATTWLYTIQGKQANLCDIEVKILQIKQGDLDRKTLEGKSMICSLDVGSISSPESDLSICHGRLKEDIQEIMIKNTHSEILSNIGDSLKGLI